MRIALIGYGEVGRILAEDLRESDHVITAFDTALTTAAGEVMRVHARAHGVELKESHAAALSETELVISAVTASQTLQAARAGSAAFPSGSFFLDLNSASPGTKISASEQITSVGGRYVEGAVMTSVPPHRSKVPLLLGGPCAAALEPVLRALGFSPRVVSDRLGVASATKMCRSVVIKGLEALLIESLTAARHYGVETSVLDSLAETFPGIDWQKQATYFFQRTIQHGRRRGEEMGEAAVTVREVGLEPWSASGTAARQNFMADLADAGLFGQRGSASFARSSDFRIEADRVLKHPASAKEESGR
jgi:3-hydroxyisobutyrate dehydrogenase-like beta-hydroxyacid dehydrogenase